MSEPTCPNGIMLVRANSGPSWRPCGKSRCKVCFGERIDYLIGLISASTGLMRATQYPPHPKGLTCEYEVCQKPQAQTSDAGPYCYDHAFGRAHKPTAPTAHLLAAEVDLELWGALRQWMHRNSDLLIGHTRIPVSETHSVIIMALPIDVSPLGVLALRRASVEPISVDQVKGIMMRHHAAKQDETFTARISASEGWNSTYKPDTPEGFEEDPVIAIVRGERITTTRQWLADNGGYEVVRADDDLYDAFLSLVLNRHRSRALAA